MTTRPEERRRIRPRHRRALAIALVALAALEAVYVGVGLYLVRSGQVERWINKNPRKLRITFDSVWPIVPGVVRVRGFRIVNQGRGDQLEGKVDRVWGAVNPFELPGRRVHVFWLRCRGVEFRLRKRPKTAEEAANLPTGFPSIDGVAWEPYTAGPPGAPKKSKKKMTIVFTRARLDEVREVWIGVRRLAGPGSVVASVTVHGDGRIAIPHADVRFDGARVENGAEETYSGVALGVLGEVPPFHPTEAKGLALVSLIRARVDLEARMPAGAGYLNAYLRNAPWIRFTGGEAGLSAHLSVAGGRLAPGGFIELSSSDRQADVAGFTIRGKARTRLDVVPAAGGAADARLVVEFDRYDLRRGADAPEPILRGQGLRILATTPASLGVIPPADFSGRLELGRAEFPRLDFVNEILPAGGGLRVRGGSAKVEGAFDVAGSGSSCGGSMKVSTEGLSLDAGGVAIKGVFSLLVAVPRGDLLTQTFDVDGTRVTLDRFTFSSQHEAAGAPDWTASVVFPKAHLSLGEAFAVRGKMELRASDSRPVAAFLSRDKPLKGWKKKLVTVGEIRGEGLYSFSRGAVEVDDFSVGWEGTEIRARFLTGEKGAHGKALVRVGILKAGIELEGKERDLHLIRPTHWYEQR
jgi:hypothetical protein